MELTVRAFVDASNAGAWMAQPEGDEHPNQSVVVVTRKLKHEGERALGCRRLCERQVELAASGEVSAIATQRIARQNVRQRYPTPLSERTTSCRNLT